MQTFLPYAHFRRSARVLDRQRLGKQRVETLQILQTLTQRVVITIGGDGRDVPRELWSLQPIVKRSWANHPAVRMWRGYELGLLEYQSAVCVEWAARGYRDTCLAKSTVLLKGWKSKINPPWLGSRDFHLSHQSNLVRKLPEHYRFRFPNVGPDLEYVWPV